MPLIEPQQFYSKIEKALESGQFPEVVCFFGDEPYLIQQASQYLKTCSLHDGAIDFNFNSYYASDTEISQIRDEIETLPMMAARRVILVKEVQDWTDAEWDVLEPVLSTPVQTSVLILVAGKIDKRRKFFKVLQEKALLVEYKKPYENQIPGWIRHIAKAHNLVMSDEAVSLFHRLVGSQLVEIEAEMKKISQFLYPRENVELEDVAQVVSQKREENVFDLTEAIASGDKVLSLTQLVRLLDQGQSELGIVALVARHIRILLAIKEGMNLGLAGQKLAQHAQVPNYYLQDYLRQARIWNPKKLENALVILSDTDRALKSSPVSSHIWLENMVLKTSAVLANTQYDSARM